MTTLTSADRWDKAMQKALRAIEGDKQIAYDVAAEHGQMVDNVRHMRWFVEAVAKEILRDNA